MSKFKVGDKVRWRAWIADDFILARYVEAFGHVDKVQTVLAVDYERPDACISLTDDETKRWWTADFFELVEAASEPETQEEPEREEESVEEPEEEILNGPALGECQKCEEPLYRVKKHGWLGLIFWEWVHVQDRLVKLDCSNVKPEPKPGTVKQ